MDPVVLSTALGPEVAKPVARVKSTRGKLRAVREPKSGMLVLEADPWVEVSIDGRSIGPTPVQTRVRAGTHKIAVSNPEFKIKRRLSLRVAAHKTVRKRLTFPETNPRHSP